jgi:DNA-binding SARP family transcriptional activator
LQLLGPGQIHYCDRPLDGFPHHQCYRLLCYLVLNRHHPHNRERLASIFWCDCSTSTSRTYLRNAIWRLRHTLQVAGATVDDYLLIGDDSISFIASSHYWLDVEVLETAVAMCQACDGHELASSQAAQLEEAVDLYVGDLLEGSYDDWCLYDRERLRLLHQSALDKLLVYHEHSGTYDRGLVYGKRLLARDPANEKVHRQMMRLYWLLGDPNEALAQYRSCTQVLREELGMRPSESTTLLYKQMVRNDFDPAVWPIHRDDALPDQIRRDESLRSTVRNALQRVKRLQAVAEETRNELQQIEHLISRALLEGSQT